MSSVSMTTAKEVYGGSDEAETIRKFAASSGFRRVYKYANDFGDKRTHSDLKGIRSDAEEDAFLSSPYTHNCVLVYDDGRVI